MAYELCILSHQRHDMHIYRPNHVTILFAPYFLSERLFVSGFGIEQSFNVLAGRASSAHISECTVKPDQTEMGVFTGKMTICSCFLVGMVGAELRERKLMNKLTT